MNFRFWLSNFLCFSLLVGLSQTVQAHEHHAPHKGALVELGDELAHVEFVFDRKTGELTGYVLDGEAENPVRVKAEAIELTIQVSRVESGGSEASVEHASLILNAVGNPLTGETAGDTSEFKGQSDFLKDAEHFSGTISSIEVNGFDFKDIKFKFPEGNE